jgi:hypothetical protein
MRSMPASHAAAMRRPATQRPRKTAFGPCLAIEQAVGFEHAPAARAADHVPDIVPHDRACRGDRDHERDLELPVVGEDPGGDERRLARQRHARRLRADEREQHEVSEASRQMDQREHDSATCPIWRRANRATRLSAALAGPPPRI